MACGCVCLCLLPQVTSAQPARDRSNEASFRWSVANTSRVESWSFFEPTEGEGDGDYAFIANRLRLGLTAVWKGIDLNTSLQYVQFGGLPTHATGPGALGTGAMYYDHSGRADSRGVYLRTLFAHVRLPGGGSVEAGRMPYQSGAEAVSGRPKVEAVKRARLDSRMIGEFEWSLYQRSFDGVRADVDRKGWHLTGAWFEPTQGGFEDDAGARLRGVDVTVLTLAVRPSVALPATDLHVFALRYNDDRLVSARPDNSGLQANRVDVHVTTIGAAAVGSAAAERGEADWLLWAAGQTGSWYSQQHRAWSVAIESGYQWTRPWQPWVRGGFLYASGDADSTDARHTTFFPMLPTVRKYAFTASYAPMNLRDVFVELIARPRRDVMIRTDIRRLWLVNAADLWYSGSGASQRQGTSFGYAGRRAGGSTDLATVFEGGADVAVGRHWSVNGFIGTMHGGRVVQSLFAGRWLRFAYVESVIQL